MGPPRPYPRLQSRPVWGTSNGHRRYANIIHPSSSSTQGGLHVSMGICSGTTDSRSSIRPAQVRLSRDTITPDIKWLREFKFGLKSGFHDIKPFRISITQQLTDLGTTLGCQDYLSRAASVHHSLAATIGAAGRGVGAAATLTAVLHILSAFSGVSRLASTYAGAAAVCAACRRGWRTSALTAVLLMVSGSLMVATADVRSQIGVGR